jgi:hypothetical protein
MTGPGPSTLIASHASARPTRPRPARRSSATPSRCAHAREPKAPVAIRHSPKAFLHPRKSHSVCESLLAPSARSNRRSFRRASFVLPLPRFHYPFTNSRRIFRHNGRSFTGTHSSAVPRRVAGIARSRRPNKQNIVFRPATTLPETSSSSTASPKNCPIQPVTKRALEVVRQTLASRRLVNRPGKYNFSFNLPIHFAAWVAGGGFASPHSTVPFFPAEH